MDKAGDVLNQLLETLRKRNQYRIPEGTVSFFNSWESIVGEDLAAHSKVKDVEGRTAVVEVDHPGWSQMMQLKKRRILKRIQKQFPALEIEEIRIQLSDRAEQMKQRHGDTSQPHSSRQPETSAADSSERDSGQDSSSAEENTGEENSGEQPEELSEIPDTELREKLNQLYQGILQQEEKAEDEEEGDN